MQRLLKIYRNNTYFIPIVLLVFIPLYLKFPLFRFSETFVSIRLEDVLIFFFTLLFIIDLIISGGWKKLLGDKLIQIMLVFFLIGAVSVFSATYLTHTITIKLGMFHLLRRVEYMMLLPLGYLALRSKKELKLNLLVIGVVAFIINIYAVGQKYLHFPVVSTINSELSKGTIYYLGQFDRISSTFSGHYDLAAFSVMALAFLSAFIFIYIDGKKVRQVLNIKKNIPLVILSLLFIFSFYILVATAARLSFVAGVAGVFFSLLLLKKGKYILIGLLILIGLSLYPSQLRDRFVSTITVNVLKSWNSYSAVTKEQENRSKLNIPTLPSGGKRSDTIGADAADIAPGEPIDTTDLGVFRSLEIRTKVEWPNAIRAFEKNPLLGTGYSSLGLATDSDILRSLGEVGILGTTAFTLILYEIVKRLWRQYKKAKGELRYITIGTLSLVGAFMVNSLVIDVFEASKIATLFWLFVGLVLAANKFENKDDEKAN
jgi:hypothetical protein